MSDWRRRLFLDEHISKTDFWKATFIAFVIYATAFFLFDMLLTRRTMRGRLRYSLFMGAWLALTAPLISRWLARRSLKT